MVSQTTEYALRAVVWLAIDSDTPLTVEQIALKTKVPGGYLSKVLQTLGRANVVKSQRGVGGGFVLVKPPAQLTVLEVINAVEPVQRILSCPLGIGQHQQLCPLHRRLDNAAARIEEEFRNCTIADLLRDPDTTPLCAEKPRAVQLGRPPATDDSGKRGG